MRKIAYEMCVEHKGWRYTDGFCVVTLEDDGFKLEGVLTLDYIRVELNKKTEVVEVAIIENCYSEEEKVSFMFEYPAEMFEIPFRCEVELDTGDIMYVYMVRRIPYKKNLDTEITKFKKLYSV